MILGFSEKNFEFFPHLVAPWLTVQISMSDFLPQNIDMARFPNQINWDFSIPKKTGYGLERQRGRDLSGGGCKYFHFTMSSGQAVEPTKTGIGASFVGGEAPGAWRWPLTYN
jgi:hypothetical protein